MRKSKWSGVPQTGNAESNAISIVDDLGEFHGRSGFVRAGIAAKEVNTVRHSFGPDADKAAAKSDLNVLRYSAGPYHVSMKTRSQLR
jgi:hypothetical protein